MSITIQGWLSDALGRSVESVEGDFYVGESGAHDSPISLWIQFVGQSRVRLFGASNGWGMGIDERPPVGTDMGSAGRIDIQQMTNRSPFSNCANSALEGADLLTCNGSPETVGVRFRFDSGEVIYVVNWGDDLFIDTQPPRDAVGSDELISEPVRMSR